jgi:hypothetical protein
VLCRIKAQPDIDSRCFDFWEPLRWSVLRTALMHHLTYLDAVTNDVPTKCCHLCLLWPPKVVRTVQRHNGTTAQRQSDIDNEAAPALSAAAAVTPTHLEYLRAYPCTHIAFALHMPVHANPGTSASPLAALWTGHTPRRHLG